MSTENNALDIYFSVDDSNLEINQASLTKAVEIITLLESVRISEVAFNLNTDIDEEAFMNMVSHIMFHSLSSLLVHTSIILGQGDILLREYKVPEMPLSEEPLNQAERYLLEKAILLELVKGARLLQLMDADIDSLVPSLVEDLEREYGESAYFNKEKITKDFLEAINSEIPSIILERMNQIYHIYVFLSAISLVFETENLHKGNINSLIDTLLSRVYASFSGLASKDIYYKIYVSAFFLFLTQEQKIDELQKVNFEELLLKISNTDQQNIIREIKHRAFNTMADGTVDPLDNLIKSCYQDIKTGLKAMWEYNSISADIEALVTDLEKFIDYIKYSSSRILRRHSEIINGYINECKRKANVLGVKINFSDVPTSDIINEKDLESFTSKLIPAVDQLIYAIQNSTKSNPTTRDLIYLPLLIKFSEVIDDYIYSIGPLFFPILIENRKQLLEHFQKTRCDIESQYDKPYLMIQQFYQGENIFTAGIDLICKFTTDNTFGTNTKKIIERIKAELIRYLYLGNPSGQFIEFIEHDILDKLEGLYNELLILVEFDRSTSGRPSSEITQEYARFHKEYLEGNPMKRDMEGIIKDFRKGIALKAESILPTVSFQSAKSIRELINLINSIVYQLRSGEIQITFPIEEHRTDFVNFIVWEKLNYPEQAGYPLRARIENYRSQKN